MGVRESFELKGRVALITGGSRGLGLQIAAGLGEMGARIAISARNALELGEAKAHLGGQGIDALTVVNDLAEAEHAPALVEAVAAHYGTVDILVNNAGTSVFMLSQAVANRCFIPQRSGNIIVVASVAALRVGARMKAAAYYASKSAALHLTRALAVEWGPYGIRANAICPGFFPSKMSSGLLASIEGSVIKATPLGRLGSDSDLKGAAVYLASDASRHVTGQYIAVDGGASIA